MNWVKINSHTIALLLLSIVVVGCFAQTDLTLQPKAKGKDVADAVIHKIERSQIFRCDQNFLRRIAYVESKFGTDSSTYRPSYYGGIWQVDQVGFKNTQNIQSHPSLRNLHAKIKQKFGITWMSVIWEELVKPLYSGLAARLFLSTIPDPIPGTLAEQAKYWKEKYNSDSGAGTEQKFINDVEILEKNNECRGRMDLCIILDGSGSIESSNFQKAKQFVADLIATFSLHILDVRVGFIVFSNSPTTIFSLDNKFSMSQIKSAILDAKYPKGGTNTNKAIIAAVKMFKSVNLRPGVPRVMTLFTDGQSNDGVSSGVDEAFRNEINSFAIGIGTGIRKDELLKIAYNDECHVFSLDNFQALAEFFPQFNSKTCTVPQKPELNSTTTDVLARNEKRYYNYELPQEGITISLKTTEGQVNGYYSYTEETPSSALYSGMINGITFIPGSEQMLRSGQNMSQVFVAIEGTHETNNYIIKAEQGDHTRNSSLSDFAMSQWTLNAFIIFLLIFSK